MSEVLTKPKAKPKRKIERYQFGDDVVELRQVDPDKREAPPESHMFGPAQRSKWEIHVNDTHLGYAFYPLGVGGDWVVTSLEPRNLDPLSEGAEPVRCWLGPTGEHGGWDDTGGMWDGLLGLLSPVKPLRDLVNRWTDDSVRWTDRPTIAAGFHRLWKQGVALTPAQVDAKIAKVKADKIARKREEAERTARYARERAERDAQQAREAEEREALRLETLEGLLSIRDKMSAQLTNFETEALMRAIERYSKP